MYSGGSCPERRGPPLFFRLEFSEWDASTTEHLVRAKVDVALDTRLSVRNNGLDPRLPLSAGRNITIKYSHALIF